MGTDQKREFKGVWIPKDIWLCKELSALDRVMLAEISSLDGEEHHCTASNEYFSEFCGVGIATITRSISRLRDLGYIEISMAEGRYRIISVLDDCPGIRNEHHQNDYPNQNDEAAQSKRLAINIDNNKKEELPNGNSKKEKPNSTNSSRFTPPTVEEVSAYCKERSNGIDPEHFIDFYASKGWYVGRSKMKDWKAAVRNWEHKHKTEQAKAKEEATNNVSRPKYKTWN